jgi:nitronate monooxygenase
MLGSTVQVAIIPIEKLCLANCLQVCRYRDTKKTYCIVQALDRSARGNLEEGLIFAGTNGGRAKKIITVRELIAELVTNSG